MTGPGNRWLLLVTAGHLVGPPALYEVLHIDPDRRPDHNHPQTTTIPMANLHVPAAIETRLMERINRYRTPAIHWKVGLVLCNALLN